MAGAALPPLAVVPACLIGLVVTFQIALAAGAPWGAVAYGRRAERDDGTLPIHFQARGP